MTGSSAGPPLLWRGLSILLLAFLFAVTVYRAATQSITIDEAYTYSQFVARPLLAMAAEYDANNHVLYTLLAKVTTAAGVTDLALRIPALAGAAVFFASLYRSMHALAGPSPWLLLGLVFVGANTYVLDLLPLARGYGLALALFTLGFSLLLDSPVRRARLAGLALGLAVAANLTLLFPVAGLLAGFLWLDRAGRPSLEACALAALAMTALLAAPMWNAGRDHFYFGTDSLWNSLGSLAGASLTHNWNERGGPVPVGSVVAAVVLGATVLAGLTLRRLAPALWLLASTIGGALLLLVAGHTGFKLPYPYGRTGLYWILLCGAGLTALAARFRIVRSSGALIAMAAGWFYVAEWSTAYTTDWQYDAGTREMAERIAALPRVPGAAPVRVGVSAPFAFSLDFYRVTRGWTWMAPVPRDDVRQGRYDYYLLFGAEREWLEAQPPGRFRVLYEHRIAGTILAVKNSP